MLELRSRSEVAIEGSGGECAQGEWCVLLSTSCELDLVHAGPCEPGHSVVAVKMPAIGTLIDMISSRAQTLEAPDHAVTPALFLK